MRPTKVMASLVAVLAIGSVASADDRGRDRGRDFRPSHHRGDFRGGHDRFGGHDFGDFRRGGGDGRFRRDDGRFHRDRDRDFRFRRPRHDFPWWYSPWHPTPFPRRGR
jgi:hypothetical protein